VIPRDTSEAAHAAQVAWLRRLTPGARVELAVRMSEESRVLAATGIRARHPSYSDDEVAWALRHLLLGRELFRRAWPQAPLLAP
jgi:hypothetical protein